MLRHCTLRVKLLPTILSMTSLPFLSNYLLDWMHSPWLQQSTSFIEILVHVWKYSCIWSLTLRTSSDHNSFKFGIKKKITLYFQLVMASRNVVEVSAFHLGMFCIMVKMGECWKHSPKLSSVWHLEVHQTSFMCIISITVAAASCSVSTLPHSSVGWLCMLFGTDHVHIVPTASLLVAPPNMSDIPQTPVLYCYLWCHGSLHLCRPGFSTKGHTEL